MKIAAVNECIKLAQKSLGDSLKTTQIVGLKDGTAIASYQSNGKLEALFSQITSFLLQVVRNTPFKQLGEYFFIELDSNDAGVFILFDDFVWSIIFDKTITPMGMVLNVHMDDFIEKFLDARSG